MIRKALWILAGVTMLASLSMAAANPWGCLKKIYFYEAHGRLEEVRHNLEQLKAQSLSPEDKNELLTRLSELGDRYFRNQNDSLAEAFYRKAIEISPPDAWPIYNKLERMARRHGRIFWNIANVKRQFRLVTRDFSGGYILLDTLFSVLMFAGLLLFFLVAFSLGIRYFKLAAHDLILEGRSEFSARKLAPLLLLLLWPLAITGGWAFYPFLLCGLLWSYFNHDERTNVKRIVILLAALALLYSIGQYMETSLRSPGFQSVRRIFSDHLFPESAWSRFDNEMKIMQAYAYYHRGQSETALDIVHATGSQYHSSLKHSLLGNLHFEKGDIAQSIQSYRQSLRLNDRDPATLKNFTVALLRNNDPERFAFYSKNYPRLNEYKDNVTTVQKEKLPERLLWKRLVNFSWQKFPLWHFLKIVLLAFLRLPVIVATLIAWMYIGLLKKFFPTLGQSVFCSRCGKIIRKRPIEQAQSHALCEECYQLFMIKDSIFLEAKTIKEKEIDRQKRMKGTLILAASLLVPGFLLNFQGRGKTFTPLFMLFGVAFGVYRFTALNFQDVFGAAPMFLNLVGVAAVALYAAINVYSWKGYSNGF